MNLFLILLFCIYVVILFCLFVVAIFYFVLFFYFHCDFPMVWGKHAEYQGCFPLPICQVIVF